MENKSGATSWMRFDKDFASMLSVVMQLLKFGINQRNRAGDGAYRGENAESRHPRREQPLVVGVHFIRRKDSEIVKSSPH